MFFEGAIFAGIGFGVSKGVSTIFAKAKINKILGNSKKNIAINRRLADAGYDDLKIGRDGRKKVYSELYERLGFEKLEDSIGYGFEFILELSF